MSSTKTATKRKRNPPYNPVTRLINYPTRFKPLIDKEIEERGLSSYPEFMGQVLEEHFNKKQVAPTDSVEEEEIIKGEKLDV